MNDKLQGEQLEAMLMYCIPGGHLCDPQVVADNIREWFASHSAALASDAQPQAPKAPVTAEPVYQTLIHGGVWNDCSKEVFEIALRDGLVPARVLYLAPPSTAQAVEAVQLIARLARQFPDCDTTLTVEQFADWLKENIPTENAQPIVPNATRGDTDPPKESGDLWTAGINLGRHGNAIECYRLTRQEAEALRDKVLAAITSPQAGAQVEREG